jgi:hypothetical protein
MKDKDLNILLSDYRKQEPTDLQVQKWKRAVRSEMSSKVESKKKLWMQLAAASVVGFLIGAVVFNSSKQDQFFQNVAKIDTENATVEYVFTNTN